MAGEKSQHWATGFGIATVLGIIAWMYFGSPPTWAVVAVFFTAGFFIFPQRMKQWFQTLGDFAQRVKDAIPIGGGS